MKLLTGSALIVAMAASPAFASELTEGIQDTLDSLQEQVESVDLGGLRLRPSFTQSVIWTDNIYLNDQGEDPFQLVKVEGGGGRTITDKGSLRALEDDLDDFDNLESEGRVDDTILKSELSVDVTKEVNPDFLRILQVESITLLSMRVRRHEYMSENDQDNTDWAINSDFLGFLDDMLQIDAGNRIWVRASGGIERLEDPLDADITDLQSIKIATLKDFRNFKRTESHVDATVGAEEGLFDAELGGGWYRRRLDDEELRQAEYDRFEASLKVGMDIPELQDKNVYMKYSYRWYRPDDRAGLDGDLQAINDGDSQRAVVGVEGSLFSEKLKGRAELGYENWNARNPEDPASSGDDSDASEPVGMLELAYQPWEDERNTKVQFTFDTYTDFSSISNYNKVREGTLTLTHSVIPELLDADVAFGITYTEASEGPRSTLYDAGFGLTYHWLDQVDVTMRYGYRKSNSRDEIKTDSSFVRTGSASNPKGGSEYFYTTESDGDFFAHTVELGLEVAF